MPKTIYVWDELSDNVIEEYQDGELSASYSHEPGLYGNLLSQNRNGATHYYHYDGRGDTVALTADSGNVTDTKEYDAWGNVIASTGSTVTPYQFGGRKGYQAEETGGTFCRARIVSPKGRWLSIDPQFLFATATAYLYCSNSPVSRIDPSGHVERQSAVAGNLPQSIVSNPNSQVNELVFPGRLPVPTLATPGCEEVCDQASREPVKRDGRGSVFCSCSLHQDQTSTGGYCNPMRRCFKCACRFEIDEPIPFGKCPELDQCGLDHEIGHLTELPGITCDLAPLGISRPSWKDPLDQILLALAECRLRTVEAKCIKGKLPKPQDLCFEPMQRRIDEIKLFVNNERSGCSKLQQQSLEF